MKKMREAERRIRYTLMSLSTAARRPAFIGATRYTGSSKRSYYFSFSAPAGPGGGGGGRGRHLCELPAVL